MSIGDLKVTIHREEVAIKRLTWALVGMTGGFIVLTVMLVLHGGQETHQAVLLAHALARTAWVGRVVPQARPA